MPTTRYIVGSFHCEKHLLKCFHHVFLILSRVLRMGGGGGKRSAILIILFCDLCTLMMHDMVYMVL